MKGSGGRVVVGVGLVVFGGGIIVDFLHTCGVDVQDRDVDG